MKKLLSFALILMICCSSAIFFGCDTKNGEVTFASTSYSLTISEDERSNEVKYLEALDRELAKITGITVFDSDGTTKLLDNKNAFEAKGLGASVQISLRQDGTFTGRFSMYGVTGTFTYTVNVGNGGSQTQTHTGYTDIKNNETQANGSDGKCDICGNAQTEAAGSEHQSIL